MMMTKKQWLSMTWYQMMEALHRVGYAHPETLREFALKQAGESPLIKGNDRLSEAIATGLSYCSGEVEQYELSYAWDAATDVAQCATDGPRSFTAAASAVEAALHGEDWCAHKACAHLVSSAVYAAGEKARADGMEELAAMAAANAEADRQMADALRDILPWEDVEPLFTAALAEAVQGIVEAAKAGEPVTRYAAARALAERGVTGEAAELLLAMRKGERAASRAQWALRCAIEHVARALPGAPFDLAWAAHVWAVLAIDAVGIGTTCKFPTDGGCTARFPAFAKCGKGRRQASDGGAWTSAIETATDLVPYGLGTKFTFSAKEEAGCGRIVANAQPGEATTLSELLFPAEWSAALAAERLKAIAKALDEDTASPEQKGEFGAWALVYNQALAEMARAKEAAAAPAAEAPPTTDQDYSEEGDPMEVPMGR